MSYERYVIRGCAGGLTDDIGETLATALDKEINSQLTFFERPAGGARAQGTTTDLAAFYRGRR